MAAVANNPKFAKKAGIPQSVGEEFMKADKGKTMKKMMSGGMTKDMKTGMKMGGDVKKCAKGGGIESKGKTKGKMVKMAMGGYAKGGMPKKGCK